MNEHAQTMLEAKDVVFRYSETGSNAIDGLSMQVKKGEYVAVLGANGCGKSTLAKHFNAILLPASGTVWIEEIPTTDEDRLMEMRQKVGMVFQNPDNQIVATVVEEDVAFALENLGVPRDEMRCRVDDAMQMAGIYKYREKAPHKLSGGQKQRVAIARALITKPQIILADEPTGALDSKTSVEVMSLLKELNSTENMTILVVTHEAGVANETNKIVHIKDGLIGEIEENLDHHANRGFK